MNYVGDSSDEDTAGRSEPTTSTSTSTQGEIIKRKKEAKKRKHDKLIKKLEKKRKLEEQQQGQQQQEVEKKRKTVFDTAGAKQGRKYTVSVALPGSILDNAQSPELRTYLAGQVARAIAVFNVDEIVVFDDEGTTADATGDGSTEGEFTGIGKRGKGCLQLARILQYLECPQYLRRDFFPIHKDLKYAGVLNPTDMPHHLRVGERSSTGYREGVVLDRPPSKRGSFVNVGLKREVNIDKKLAPALRVTVRIDDENEDFGKSLLGRVVAPSVPRTESGLYWGYSVRLAGDLSSVFSKCPFPGGYDHTVGTSERGSSVDECVLTSGFKHLLVVLGGVKGLEAALEADNKLEGSDPEPLFDLYLNTCPDQGSRTIRLKYNDLLQ